MTVNTIDFESMPVEEVVTHLQDMVDNPDVAERNRGFAGDLVHGKYGFNSRGYLTEKQLSAARRMLDREMNKPEPDRTVDLAKVHSFIKNAKRFLKYPKLWLQLQDGTPVKLNLSGQRSKYPDTINLKVDDVWYGRVLDDGEWHQPRSAQPETVGELKTLLERLAGDPAGVATEYGKITGNCCFCHRKLTDERSLDAGFQVLRVDTIPGGQFAPDEDVETVVGGGYERLCRHFSDVLGTHVGYRGAYHYAHC